MLVLLCKFKISVICDKLILFIMLATTSYSKYIVYATRLVILCDDVLLFGFCFCLFVVCRHSIRSLAWQYEIGHPVFARAELGEESWRYQYPLSVHRIELNRMINQDFDRYMLTVLNHLMPDLLTTRGIYYGDNYLRHIVYCLYTNPDFDTTLLDQWVDDQIQQGVPLSLYSIPVDNLVHVLSYLNDIDHAHLAGTSKIFANYHGSITHLHDEYRKWCSLVYHEDNLKDKILSLFSNTQLLQLFTKDVRVLSPVLCDELQEVLEEVYDITRNQSINNEKMLATLPPDLLLYIATFFSEREFFNIWKINFDWLKFFSSAQLLQRLQLFDKIQFDNDRLYKWDTTGSSWFAFQGVRVFEWMVSSGAKEFFPALHVPLFYGNNLVFYHGTEFHVNLGVVDVSRLSFVSFKPRAWTCPLLSHNYDKQVYHKSWYALAHYLNEVGGELDY